MSGQGKASKSSARSAARLRAVQALYEIGLSGTSVDEVLMGFMHKRWDAPALRAENDPDEPDETPPPPLAEPDSGLFVELVRGVSERRDDLDRMIAAAHGDQGMDRPEEILRAILRAGAFELLAKTDVPAKVVINEYVDVANAFFTQGEPKLVNGLLDRLARTLREDEMPERPR